MKTKALHFGFCLLLSAAMAPPSGAQEKKAVQTTGNKLIAIDILLEPDQTMVDHANALNARLRSDYPAGYHLDATHAPHVTLLQRFTREKDFDSVTAAVAKVLATEQPAALQLKAVAIDYVMWSGVAVTVYVIERTPELMRLHEKIIGAVEPFSVSGGTAAAFVGGDANAETIGWVETFVPNSSGKDYIPHVTAGVATEGFVKQMKAQPYQSFTFKPVGVGIYHLGNFGTAAKELWESRRVNH
jgi:2'-5' RNA ligase superfamily